ncbi:MAG: hypothetical protein C4346_04985 [Chloroflexota bacterium]
MPGGKEKVSCERPKGTVKTPFDSVFMQPFRQCAPITSDGHLPRLTAAYTITPWSIRRSRNGSDNRRRMTGDRDGGKREQWRLRLAGGAKSQ